MTFIQHSSGSLSQNNKQEKEIKDIQIGRKKVKLFLLAHMSLYIKKKNLKIPPMAHVCNSSYQGGKDWGDFSSRQG
jgi:hypothetical protein